VSQTIFSHAYPNGLVLVGEPMGWLQSAAFTFLVPAGCVYDSPERSGLSGFTCDMALRGAGKRDRHQFVMDLDNLGVERSDSISAAHTIHGGATLAENLPAALDIYVDLLREPHLPADQLESARQVMLQELRAVEDEPTDKVIIELYRRHYPQPWGRPSQGEQQALQSVTLDDVRRFYQECYHPNGTILGVAGQFDWAALKDLVGELLGDWQPGQAYPITERPAGPAHDHLPYDSEQTHLAVAWASVPYRDPDYYQAWGAASALGGGMSARLFTEVRERRGLCYSVYASYHTLRDRGTVHCYAGTSAERAQETLDVLLAEVVRLGRGIEEHELGRVKARSKSALVMQQESSFARSATVARDWYHLGRARGLEEVSRQIDGLTCASINVFLAAHPPGDFTIVTLGPRELEVHGGVL